MALVVVGLAGANYHNALNQAYAKISELDATIGKMKGLKPGTQGSGGPSSNSEFAEKPKGIAGFVDSQFGD